MAAIARDGGGRKGVTQATADRRNLNFKPHWKWDATLALAFGGAGYQHAVSGAERQLSGSHAASAKRAPMFEAPILLVLAVLAIGAILWWIFR